MNEPNRDETAEAEFPRLRIHHFFVFTTVFAVVMSVWLGFWRLMYYVRPESEKPEFGASLSFIFSVESLSLSACFAIVLLGLAWRKRGISFPSQPGHWMAIYLAISWVYEIVAWGISFFPLQLLGLDSMIWVTMPVHLAFYCFAFALWVAVYLHETSRIWKLGWAAMAFKSLLLALWALFNLGAKCLEWLLEVFQFNTHFDSDFFFLLGPYDRIFAKIFLITLSTYPLILFLPVAAIIDLRQHHQRHWSHWLVVVSTFVSTAIMTVYYHLAF